MTAFLIQVSGEETGHEETHSDYFWEEPIKEGIYINHHWKKDIWEKVKQEDKVLIYCTGSVEPYPKQISHVAEVTSVERNEQKAVMRLIITKLSTGIPLQLIEEEIESGKLSEAMSKCGTQGFNIGIIENSDFDWIVELSTKIENAHEIAQAETETKIQEILESNVEVIEKGFQLVNKDSVLPPNSGIPDLICKDKIGNFVVIELKAGEASYHALGQAISYKGAIKKRTGGLVRAIVIGYSFDPKILFAKVLKDSDGLQLVEFKRYGLKAEILDN